MKLAAPAQRGIRLSDRVLIAGQTGKGKTELAKFIVKHLMPVRLIVIDPKGELDFGIAAARSAEQLVAMMHQPIVHFIPASFQRDALEEIFQIIHITPGPFILWIDEGSEVSGPHWCPEGLRLTVTQGRQSEKMVIVLTQRLAEIHPVFRSQSEHVFLTVPAPILLDLKTVAGNVRREATTLDRELGDLHAECGDFSHLWYVRDTDELRRCAPVPIGGPPLRAAGEQPADAVESEPCADSEQA